MGFAKATNNLADKYLQFFVAEESTTAVTTLETYEYDTGMSPRGGWLWEVHSIEMLVGTWMSVPAAGSATWIKMSLSFIGNATVIPTPATYGCIHNRIVQNFGNGTNVFCQICEPPEGLRLFPRPLLYAKNKIWLYEQKSTAAATSVYFKVGYTTRKVSGPLLWEAVEQFLSSE